MCIAPSYFSLCSKNKLNVFFFFSTEESYTVRLPVNVLNTAIGGEGRKPFTKIGFVEFSSDATLSEIRAKLKREFSAVLHGRVFLFQDSMMADVEPSHCASLLRIISRVISARALKNGGFFFTAGPRHRGKSSFSRKRVW